jgi:hypothetical protein
VNEESARLAWYVCRFQGPIQQGDERVWEIRTPRRISDEDYEGFRRAVQAIEDESEQEGLNLVLSRFKLYIEYCRSVTAALDALSAETWNPMRRIQAELQGRLFDWLQSIRAYLDLTETRLKRRYGKNSEQVNRFKSASARAFDAHFAYRFFYKLRNAQHTGFAPVAVAIRSVALPSGTERWASLEFDRDELLQAYDKWGVVRKDLEQMHDRFGIEEHVGKMMDCLEEIADEVGQIEEPFLGQQMEVIEGLLGLAPPGEGSPQVVRLPADPTLRPKAIPLQPIPEVRWKPKEWEWMKNYRVWKANRKVFLYPENWVEPEARDDKSDE